MFPYFLFFIKMLKTFNCSILFIRQQLRSTGLKFFLYLILGKQRNRGYLNHMIFNPQITTTTTWFSPMRYKLDRISTKLLRSFNNVSLYNFISTTCVPYNYTELRRNQGKPLTTWPLFCNGTVMVRPFKYWKERNQDTILNHMTSNLCWWHHSDATISLSR